MDEIRVKVLGKVIFWSVVAELVLSGCASTSRQGVATSKGEVSVAKVSSSLEKVPDRPFSSETLYALLVAEMAIDRKRYDIALGNYVQQAASTRDIEVVERATQVARILKAHQPALEMAELWLDLEPQNADAQLIVTAELVAANRLLDAFDQSVSLLSSGHNTAFHAIAVKASETDAPSLGQLRANYATLVNDHPGNAQILLGYSILLQKEGSFDRALLMARKASRLESGSIRSVFQESRVLHQMGRKDEAIERFSELVNKNPENQGLRARYARMVSSVNLPESLKQFQILHQQNPNDGDVLFSLALVEKELGQLEKAAAHFDMLVVRGQHVSSAHYHLGLILEQQEQQALALEHYQSILPGQNYLSGAVRAVNILVKSQRADAALHWLKMQTGLVPEMYREGLYMLEADVFSMSDRQKDAELRLSTALVEYPQSEKLLYARAMLYTKQGKFDEAENDLDTVVRLFPENAAALNALGYTLADRNRRLDEAYAFVKKALKLVPNDPAVLDSMGWVEYRRGNLKVALTHLQQAMKVLPDHEIAAHLGEVLWVTGDQEGAKRVWRQGLGLKADSAVLKSTLERFGVSLSD